MAPKTVVTAWFLTLVSSGETEPLGERIIEVATNLLQFVNKDSRTLFIAYVPKGSIEKGRAQAASGEACFQNASRLSNSIGRGLRTFSIGTLTSPAASIKCDAAEQALVRPFF
jgi:hypothetical protein